MKSEMQRSLRKVNMSQPPTQSVATPAETGAAAAMKHDILHSIDAAGFLESAPDAMVIVDEEGRIVAVNTLAEKLFGYRRKELIGELVEMLVTDRSRNRHVDLRSVYIADPLPWTVGADLGLYGLPKDGKELSIEISLSPLVTPAGRLVLSAIRDFTHVERMKEQLRQGAEELQKVMDVAPVALFVSHDPECREIIGNRAGNAMFESKDGTNLLSTPADGSLPNWRFFRDGVAVRPKELPSQLAAATGTEVRGWEAEAMMPSGARKVILGHASPLRDATGVVRGAVAAYQDITAIRQRTEAELDQSQEQMQHAMDSAQLGLWGWDISTDEIWASDQTSAMFGLPPNLKLDHATLFNSVYSEDRENVQRLLEKAMREPAECWTEFRILLPDGSERWIRCHGRSYLGPNGAPERLMGVFLDITERKQIEESLSEQLAFETLLAEVSAMFINLPANQVDGKIEEAQKQICEALDLDRSALGQVQGDRYTVTHWWTRKGFETTLPIAPQELPWLARMLLDGREVSFVRIDDLPQEAEKDKEALRRHGQKSNVTFPLSAGGKVIGAVAFASLRKEREWTATLLERLRLVAEVFANALERKRASEELQTAYSELRQQKEILQNIFDHIPVMIGFGSGKGLQLVNQAWEQTLGWTLEEIHRDKLDFMKEVYPDTRYREQVLRFFLNSNGKWADFRNTTRDGRIIDVSWIVLQLPDGTGMGIGQDITERKRAEEALRESEERFRNMADTAPVMIWVAGPDKLCTFFNKCCLDFTGQSLEQKTGDGWIAGVHPEDREQFLATYSSSFDARQGFQTVFRLHRADGEYRWVQTTGIPRFGPGGVFAGFIGSCTDVTEIKRASEQLLTAYSEIQQLKQRLEQDNLYLQEEITLEHHGVVGGSEKVRHVLKTAEQVAKTTASVLLLGETGTGKELIARAIHSASNRNQRLMVKVNCAALPAALVESELFGRERGAYTGALTREIGRFELANGSTLFLDEVGELPHELQAKLLRVLQEGEFERLGSSRTIRVDVRLIAATSRNLELAMKEGRFREDLFYRLNVFPITIPPLRERREDIPPLVWHFVNELGQRMGRRIESIHGPTMEAFKNYSWPGNVRELRNVIERFLITNTGTVFRADWQSIEKPATSVPSQVLEEVERTHILGILESTSWKVRGATGAAKILGLKPTTLESRMIKLGITRPNRPRC
jgi:formate hydrogenlyase transcriptional activator